VRIRVHLVARLLRIPLLRIDGEVITLPDAAQPGEPEHVGPRLASTERVVAQLAERARAREVAGGAGRAG